METKKEISYGRIGANHIKEVPFLNKKYQIITCYNNKTLTINTLRF